MANLPQRRFQFVAVDAAEAFLSFQVEGTARAMYRLWYRMVGETKVATRFARRADGESEDETFAHVPARARLLGLPADVRLPGEALPPPSPAPHHVADDR